MDPARFGAIALAVGVVGAHAAGPCDLGSVLEDPIFSQSLGASELAIGDLNNDAIPDLVVSRGASNEIAVHLSDGLGGLAPGVVYGVGSLPLGIAIADLDDDGWMDVVVGNSLSTDLSVLMGEGLGALGAESRILIGEDVWDVEAADLNGDLVLDLVVSASADTFTGQVSVLLGEGDGTFSAPASRSAGARPTVVMTADLDLDGQLDVVTANTSDGTIGVSLNNGDGALGPEARTGVGAAPLGLALGDVDGDGFVDVVAANWTSSDVTLLLGAGDGSFSETQTIGVGGLALDVSIEDMNDDGLVDLVVSVGSSNDEIRILWGQPDGVFDAASASGFAIPGSSYRLGLADLDESGSKDAVVTVADGSGLAVLLNGCLCRTDLNGDGTLDFFDLSIFLTNRLDLNGDTVFDFFDLSGFLQDFAAGCS